MRAILLLAVALVYSTSVLAQVPVALSPVARQQFLDANAKPLAGGKVCTFNAGTTTPAASYVDTGGVILNTNPIVLDSGGFATIYLASQSYKITVYDASGNTLCPNSGVQQWSQDNVNAFQPVTGALSIIFAGVTSDPAGVAGQVDYRSDIPCFRSFTSVWDCFVRLNDTQTLANKTITAPTITGPTVTAGTFATPTINNAQIVNSPATYVNITNDTIAGTSLNNLTKLTAAAPSTVVNTSGVDTGGVIGICTSNCGSTGTATIQQSGNVNCVFDVANAVAGDYVQISSSTSGKCKDAGATYPSTGQVIGRALASGSGSVAINLFGPEIKTPTSTNVVFAVNLTSQTANIAPTTITTPGANGFYRVNCYTVVTTAAGTSSTLPQCIVNWTDADSNFAETNVVTGINAANTVGAFGTTPVGNNSFYAKSGVAITYQTSSYASNPASAMNYSLHLRLEGPL